MKKHLLYLPLLAVLLFSGCGKDDDNEPAATKTQLLTAKPWKLTAFTVEPAMVLPDGTSVSDLFGQMQACDKDDTHKYEAASASATSGTTVTDEGATKCDPDNPQTYTGTWVFSSDQTKITEDGTTYDILELTSTTMKQRFVEQDTSGVNYTFTGTFSH